MKLASLTTQQVNELITAGMVCPCCRSAHGKLIGGQTRVYVRYSVRGLPRFPTERHGTICYACMVGIWDGDVAWPQDLPASDKPVTDQRRNP